MTGEYEGIRNYDVLPPPSSKNNNLGDVVGSQRLAAPVLISIN